MLIVCMYNRLSQFVKYKFVEEAFILVSVKTETIVTFCTVCQHLSRLVGKPPRKPRSKVCPKTRKYDMYFQFMPPIVCLIHVLN